MFGSFVNFIIFVFWFFWFLFIYTCTCRSLFVVVYEAANAKSKQVSNEKDIRPRSHLPRHQNASRASSHSRGHLQYCFLGFPKSKVASFWRTMSEAAANTTWMLLRWRWAIPIVLWGNRNLQRQGFSTLFFSLILGIFQLSNGMYGWLMALDKRLMFQSPQSVVAVI